MEEELNIEQGGRKISKGMLGFLAVLMFGVLLAGGFAAYYYGLSQKSGSSNGADEVSVLVTEVGKRIDLPEGEIPTVATVADKTKLEGQAFFKKSENGDKVLIYTKSGKAFLYRPSTKRIVDVSVINVEEDASMAPEEAALAADDQAAESEETLEDTSEEADSDEDSPFPSIALYNGTEKKGLTQRQEDVILAGFRDVAILEKEKSNNAEYQKTIIVNVSGTYADLAASLAKKYKAEITDLPMGERETAADILIIFGEDQL